MTKSEIKSRVDFRMKQLLMKGVRVIWKGQEFGVTEYDFYDNTGMYQVCVSDRVDPIEMEVSEMIRFLNTAVRKDGVAIPKFEEDATVRAGAGSGERKPPAPKGAYSCFNKKNELY